MPTSATTTSSASRPPCARSWPRTSPSSGTSTPSTRAWRSSRTSRSSGRSSRRWAPATTRWTPPPSRGVVRRGLHLLELARLHRPVPRPPCPLHQPARPLRPHAGGRGLLAGRREAPAAPAHLRHGLGVGQGAGRPSPPAGGGRAPRPPQARCRAGPLLLPRGDRLGPGRVPSQGRHGPPADGGLLAASATGRRLRVRVHPPHHQGRAVRDLGPSRLVRRRDVPAHGARRRTASTTSSR